MNRAPGLPPHIEDTVHTIAELHAQHYRNAGPFQRYVRGLTQFIGSAAFVVVLTACSLGWIGFNLSRGGHPIDPVPFFGLQGTLTALALYVSLTVLATARHEHELSEARAQLTLELAVLAEQKSAKTIELLESLRHDHPDIEDHDDPEATQMARPASPQRVADAIAKTQDEMIDDAGSQPG